MAETGKDLIRASALLIKGETVAIPTETVYGLAANALDKEAVTKIFAVKNRPADNPLIVHIAEKNELEKYVLHIPSVAEKLAERFWPGPLTLLLPKKNIIPGIVTSLLPDVGIRIPSHPLTLRLLRSLDVPLAAPSANPFGYISPTTAEHVQRQIGNKISYILDGGPCTEGIESTIVGFEFNTPVIYRLGAIPAEAIQEVSGKVKIACRPASQPVAPGMLPYHYSPQTPLYVTEHPDNLISQSNRMETGVITFDKKYAGVPEDHHIILSPKGDLKEAARNLYHTLHLMDGMKLKRIIAEKLPDKGLGKTINDRLERAAAKHSNHLTTEPNKYKNGFKFTHR